MKNKTLQEKVAQEIDRATQNGCVDSLFDSDSEEDPAITKYKNQLLLHAARIIKIVQKDLKGE